MERFDFYMERLQSHSERFVSKLYTFANPQVVKPIGITCPQANMRYLWLKIRQEFSSRPIFIYSKKCKIEYMQNMFASQFYIFGTKKMHKITKKFKKYAKNYIIFKNFQKKQNRVLKKRKFCDIMYLQKRLCCCITIYGGIIWIQKLQV